MHKTTQEMFDNAQKRIFSLSEEYDVPASSIVWMADNSFIVVKDGQEIRIY